MKILYYLFVILFTSAYSLTKAQSYSDEKIKEFYETMGANSLLNNGCSTLTNVFGNCGTPIMIDPCTGRKFLRSTQIEGASYYMLSLIKMYETTKDRAYMIKAVNLTINIQELRNDVCLIANDSASEKGWVTNIGRRGGGAMYQDGHASMAMAKLAYTIFNNPTLFNSTTPKIDFIAINNLGVVFDTYGDFAIWLKTRVSETLQWYIDNGYWKDRYAFRQERNHNYGMPLNFQIGYAVALRYIGTLNGNIDFLDKSEIMASLFKGNIKLKRIVDGVNNCIEQSVLLLQPNNSYSWFHFGWRNLRNKSCGLTINEHSDYDNYISRKEAINYFAVDIQFPIAYTELPQYGSVFNTMDMIRFRNTLSKNIYNPTPDPGDYVFYNAVDGTHGPISRGDDPPFTPPLSRIDILRPILVLMPLYKYDTPEDPRNVYDILMKHYVNIAKPLAANWFSGALPHLGLAETVSAQWDKECQSLSLYNRKLIYNQDFFTDNILTIEPKTTDEFHALGDEAFADPKTPDAIDVFTIESGVTSNISAGKKVVLKPGFHAKAGSRVKISIDESLTCSSTSSVTTYISNNIQGQSITNYSYFEEETPFIIDATPVEQTEQTVIEFKAIPNPNSGSFFITSDNNTNITRIEAYSNVGELMFVKDKLNKTSVSINANLISGLYFIKVWNGEQSSYVKVMIN